MQTALIRTIPPGGWHFNQPLPWGGERKIEESGFEELVDEITKFRVNNRIPLGDPIREVQEYVVTTFPSFAGSVSMEVPERDFDAEAKNLRERWTNRASNWYALRAGGHTQLLEGEEVQRRREICQSCPHNKEVPSDCHSCVVNTNRTLFLISQGKAQNTSLGACAVLGHDNATASLLPEAMTKYANRFQENLPSFCWLKNSPTNTQTSSTPTEPTTDEH